MCSDNCAYLINPKGEHTMRESVNGTVVDKADALVPAVGVDDMILVPN
jgi:hypothetical protein